MKEILCNECGRGIGFWTGPDESPCRCCPQYPSWKQIEEIIIEKVENHNETCKTELIVGIQRGGLVAAVLLSHLLKIPMETINYSSLKGEGDNRTEHTNKIPHFDAQNILLVDDLNDSGWTMKEVADEYERRGINIVTFVLHHKKSSVFTPTIKCWTIPEPPGPWIHYPWEIDTNNEKR